jgi:hypothetical protein
MSNQPEPSIGENVAPRFVEGQEVWVKGVVSYVFGDDHISVSFLGAWDEANYYSGPSSEVNTEPPTVVNKS